MKQNAAKFQKHFCIVFLALLLCSCVKNNSEYSSGSSFAGYVKEEQKIPIVYPMKNPSITEGRKIWEKLDCASCHGDNGKSPNGKSKIDLSDEFFIYRETPIRIYKLLTIELPLKGHPRIAEPEEKIWDVVFFVRSLACPPFDEAELAKMKVFFSANCSGCHGPEGYGDGPLSKSLDPRPANFHQYNREFDRQDFMLFNHIANGLFPSAMPAWRGYTDPNSKVIVDDRFLKKLVEYVRHFHVDAGENPKYWWSEKTNGAAPIMDADELEKDCCERPPEKK